MANTSNYMEQGGSAWVIGGSIDFQTGAMIKANGTQAAAISDVSAATGVANNADVTTVVALKSEYDTLATAFNALKTACEGAGIVAGS